jgi:hypothetical protein
VIHCAGIFYDNFLFFALILLILGLKRNGVFEFFVKFDYRFMLDEIIPIIGAFFAKAIIAISRLLLSISLE